MKKNFSKEDCLKWFQNTTINPQTNRKITTTAKTGIYKELQKQCEKYKQSEVKNKSISPQKKSTNSVSPNIVLNKNDTTDINKLMEYEVHTEKPYKEIEDMDQAMKDACPTKNFFNKAYFQYFVGQYISKRTNFKNLLLYYTVGTGKTCAAVSIAESILIGHNNFDDPPVIVVLPRTLMDNFKDTIYDLHKKDINQCSENIYKNLNITTQQGLNKLISKRYNIMTYYEFIKYSDKNSKIQNKTIIIDEAHNLRNSSEIETDNEQDMNINKDTIYDSIKQIITNGENNRLILMSGTPMFNESDEIRHLLNLFLINSGKKTYTRKLQDIELAKLSKEYISYINNHNPFIYPMRISPEDAIDTDKTPDGLIKVKLNKKQENYVKDSMTLLNNIKYMNIAYDPNDYFINTNKTYKPKPSTIKVLNSDNIETYSPKIAQIIKYIKKTTGTAIIYSAFIDYGILQIALALEYLGYSRLIKKNQISNLLDDNTVERNPNLNYSIITSQNNNYISNVGTNTNIKDILQLFNNEENVDGSKLKLVLITKKASEGLSLLNVREVHILDPWYHFNRNEQIVGRGIRRCSHINLPIEKRNITIFTYCGIFESKKESADEHAYNIAISKYVETKNNIKIIEENAFDNRINEKLNIFPRSLFNKVNPINIITSQNNKREFFIGDQNKEYTNNISDLSDANIREETMFLTNNYVNYITKIIKNREYIPYNELLEKYNNKRYLDLAINKILFPNKIGNFLLFFNNDEIQKVEDIPNKKIIEIILENNIKTAKPVIDNYNIKVYENIKKDFERLYKFLMFINNQNWEDIAIDIIKNKDTLYPKLYKVLSHKLILVNDKYFDLFASEPITLKNINKEIVEIDFKYENQIIKEGVVHGVIGTTYRSKGNLIKNLIFKLVKSANKRGTNCITEQSKMLEDLTTIQGNKLEKCINIAEKFDNEDKLLIIPYIKMKK